MESWHRKFVHLPSCYFSEKANFKILLFYWSSTPTSSRIAHSKITRYTENILFQLQRWQKKRKIKWKDILRTNLPTLPSKKIWLKITCNARINRPRDGNSAKNAKIFFAFVSFAGKGRQNCTGWNILSDIRRL